MYYILRLIKNSICINGSVTFRSLIITRCKKSLVTRYKIRSLLVGYFLKKLLTAKNHSLLVAKFACSKKSLAFCCKFPSILIAKKVFIVCLKSTKLGGSFSFFNIICFLRPKNSKLFKSRYYR